MTECGDIGGQRVLASVIVFLLLLPSAAREPSAAANESQRLSATGYIEYWPGTLPVILSAPHGGTLAPKELPDRGSGVLLRDGNTIELSLSIRAAMQKRYGAAPALIVCRVARRKLDCNREIIEAAQGDPLAGKAWREYHAFIDEAKTELLKHHPHGLYLDIHGHAHEKQRIELGYALSIAEIQFPDATLEPLGKKSSIRSLDELSKATFAELLRGPGSLGGLLEAKGIPSVPSPTAVIEKDDRYFNGGYDIRQHGSMNGGNIDAIQLEYPKAFRDTSTVRENAATALSDVLDAYFKGHYGTALDP